jgi:hypothetical protein
LMSSQSEQSKLGVSNQRRDQMEARCQQPFLSKSISV